MIERKNLLTNTSVEQTLLVSCAFAIRAALEHTHAVLTQQIFTAIGRIFAQYRHPYAFHVCVARKACWARTDFAVAQNTTFSVQTARIFRGTRFTNRSETVALSLYTFFAIFTIVILLTER